MIAISEIKVADINLHVLHDGQGLPVVFIHGWAASHRFWKYQIPHFKRNYQVVTYDLRGHGESDKPSKGYTVNEQTQDLELLLEGLNIENPVLVGHSLGGMIALEYALKAPNNLRALVIVGASAHPVASRRRSFQFTLLSWLIRISRNRASKYTQKEIFAPNVDPELVDWVNTESLRTPTHVILQILKSVKKFDVMNRLQEIKVPTVLVKGEYDTVVESSDLREMQERLPDARQFIIDNAGHNCMLEQPSLFNPKLEHFLQNVN